MAFCKKSKITLLKISATRLARINAGSIFTSFLPLKYEKTKYIIEKIRLSGIKTKTPGQPEINIKIKINKGPSFEKPPR